MHRIATCLDMAHPAAAVWAVLTDLDSYRHWNPFVTAARGEARLGARLAITVQHPAGTGQVLRFAPVVSRLDPQRAFAWDGSLVSGLLFGGEHWFRIEATAEDSCRFHHGEDFRGLAIAVLGRRGVAAMQPGYDAMNRALASEVARRATASA